MGPAGGSLKAEGFHEAAVDFSDAVEVVPGDVDVGAPCIGVEGRGASECHHDAVGVDGFISEHYCIC